MIHRNGLYMCIKVHIEKLFWEDARAVCRHEHSDLVVLNTTQKAIALKHELNAHPNIFGGLTVFNVQGSWANVFGGLTVVNVQG